MFKDEEGQEVERTVLEFRRTVSIPKVSSEKFAFERHNGVWHYHVAAASQLSLTQLEDIIAAMKTLPLKEEKIQDADVSDK